MIKLSLITVSLNSQKIIKRTIDSINNQTSKEFETIYVDGKSNDETIDIIKKNYRVNDKLIVESDKGSYEAMNKGIKAANGYIIGILNSGDTLAKNNIIEKIITYFENNEDDIIYGHSLVFKKDKIVRRNISPEFNEQLMFNGWFPSHQSIYIKKKIYEEYNFYNTRFKISSDYDFFLKVVLSKKFKINLLDEYIVNFYLGGKSNKSIKNILISNYECYLSWKINYNKIYLKTIPFKLIRKVFQKFS